MSSLRITFLEIHRYNYQQFDRGITLSHWFKAPWINNWTESLHFIVVAIGLIGGGFWALYTFDVLLQKDAAVESLSKAKAELQEIRERIDGNYASNIDITTKQVPLADNKYGLFINVRVQNVGTNDIYMKLGQEPLTVYKTGYKADKIKAIAEYKPAYIQSLAMNKGKSNDIFDTQYLTIGSIKNIPFFVEVTGSGVYLMTFQADVSKQVGDKLEPIDKTPIWFSSKYEYVGKDFNKGSKKTSIESDNELSAVYFMTPNQKISTLP